VAGEEQVDRVTGADLILLDRFEDRMGGPDFFRVSIGVGVAGHVFCHGE
jgi:hypothetical protein